VDPAKLASLEGLLQEIQDSNPTGHHPALPLADLKRLHFGSMVIFKDPDGNSVQIIHHPPISAKV